MAASKKVHGFLFMSRSLDRSYVLNMPTIAEAGELQVISYINNYILEVGEPITIKLVSLYLKTYMVPTKFLALLRQTFL